jgi:hypothetical protein
MKKFLNLALLLFSLCGYSQIQEIFTENLIKSNFDSIKIYNDKKEKMLLTAVIKYRKEQNDFIFYNYEKPKNPLEKEVLYTELKFDETYRLTKEKEFLKGVNIIDNQLKDTIFSRVTEFIYQKNTIKKNSYSPTGKLDRQIFQINNEKGREKEIINILYSNNNVIVSDIKKYDWYPKGNGYKFESEQFTYPRQKFIGYYKVDKYGKIKSMKGKLNVEGQEEKVNRYKLPKLEEELDERGNIVKIFEIEKGKRILKEERQIFYRGK